MPFLPQIISVELKPKIPISPLLFPYWPAPLMCFQANSAKELDALVDREDVYRVSLRQMKGLADVLVRHEIRLLLSPDSLAFGNGPRHHHPHMHQSCLSPCIQRRAGKLMVCLTCVWVSKTTAIQSACNPEAVSGLWMAVIVRLTPTPAIRCLFLSA